MAGTNEDDDNDDFDDDKNDERDDDVDNDKDVGSMMSCCVEGLMDDTVHLLYTWYVSSTLYHRLHVWLNIWSITYSSTAVCITE